MRQGSLTERAVGCLIGAFAGDALGMPYEAGPGDEVPERLEMIDGRAPGGTYTDDTQMMIGLAESLLRCGRVDQDDLAATFLEVFEPTRGYGGGTQEVLAMWRAAVPTAEASARLWEGQGSPNDGAAMRVAPLALAYFEDEQALVGEAEASARVTHTHPEGIDGAVVQAVAVAAALRGEDPLARALARAATDRMRARLTELCWIATDGLDPRLLTESGGRVGFRAVQAVPVAVVVGSVAATFEQAVTVGVRCGGDTDTVAAMAGAVAGARFGIAAIPRRWYHALEDARRGRGHVEQLALRLIAAARDRA